MSNNMSIDQMLKINEEFKKKGLLLSSEDLFDRLRLRDDMKTECWKIRQEYILEKLEMDKKKATRTIELKAVVDDKWKWLTEKAIDGNIKQEFYDEEISLSAKKATYELLYERAESIIDFINVVKLNLKSDF
jgi:hypothetical protein